MRDTGQPPPSDHGCGTLITSAVAAAARADGALALATLGRWRREFEKPMLRIECRFAPIEVRRRVATLLRGISAELPRTNC